MRRLYSEGYGKLLTRTHDELDLCDAVGVTDFLEESQPETVIVAAAKVGGIYANATYPGRVHIRESGNRIECDPRGLQMWREAVVVPREFVHLSSRCAAADA